MNSKNSNFDRLTPNDLTWPQSPIKFISKKFKVLLNNLRFLSSEFVESAIFQQKKNKSEPEIVHKTGSYDFLKQNKSKKSAID